MCYFVLNLFCFDFALTLAFGIGLGWDGHVIVGFHGENFSNSSWGGDSNMLVDSVIFVA
jgi:hypothetical protein